jgi:hypothetical protein
MSWLDAFFNLGPSPVFAGTVTAGALAVGGAATVGGPLMAASLVCAGPASFNGATAQGAPPTVAQVTDSTGGTPSSTLAAIAAGSSYTQADMVAAKNALASIAAEVNGIQAALSVRGGGVGFLA